MNETRSNLGLGLLALFSIVCCIGLPLIIAAGISVALAAWVGGIALGALALIAMVAFVALRARRRDAAPPTSILRRGS